MEASSVRLVLVGAFIAVGLGETASAQAGTTRLVSVSSSGVQGDRESRMPAVSADGRYVVFESRSTNLVPGDSNGFRDVFLRDMTTGQTARVSVSSSGDQADAESIEPAISTDGRYVAFASFASNLVLGDTNGTWDVFVHDTQGGVTTRVSLDSAGNQASGPSLSPALSADGLEVVFTSAAPDLVSGDTNGVEDIFLRDLASGTTRRVSVDSAGVQGNLWSRFGAISADGSRVAFSSLATNLVSGDTNDAWDVFLHDLGSGATTRVSVSSTGTQGDDASRYPSLSADGRHVAFSSLAHSLVGGDTNDASDVFVHDTVTGQTTLESRTPGGAPGDGTSEHPSLSADGLRVAFMSDAPDLVGGDGNDGTDVFVRELATGLTTRASVDPAGLDSDGISYFPALSADGAWVAFMSQATNLAGSDGNGTWDVFLRELDTSGGISTYCTASTTSIPGCQALLSWTGTPSLSNPAGFSVVTGPMPGKVNGLAYLGKTGPASTPFGTLGGYICVGSPVYRATGKASGGTKGACDGQLAYTLAELISAHAPIAVPGTVVNVALWFRDPANPDTFALSNGLQLTVLP